MHPQFIEHLLERFQGRGLNYRVAGLAAELMTHHFGCRQMFGALCAREKEGLDARFDIPPSLKAGSG